MAPRINQREDDNAYDAAMTGHSPFPHSQDGERFSQHLGLVEKNVTEPATDHHAEERDPGYKIAQCGLAQIEIAAPGENPKQQVGEEEGEDIRHAVPARPDISR